jgi:signal transduction histidine kinase
MNASDSLQERGQVQVQTRLRGDDGEISVQDIGTGIDTDFLPHLFDAFAPKSSRNAREVEGFDRPGRTATRYS